MSVTPESTPGLGPANSPASGSPSGPVQTPRTPRTWQKNLLRICFALFTFEIGLFLVIFPWTDNWNINYFQEVIPWFQDLWYEPAFRGALTGLGFVNLYIACLQVVRSFRKS